MKSHNISILGFFALVFTIISFSVVFANNSPRNVIIDNVTADCDSAVVEITVSQDNYWIDAEIYNDVTDPGTALDSQREFGVATGTFTFTLNYPLQTNTNSLRVFVGLEVDEPQPYEATDTFTVPVSCLTETPTLTSLPPTSTESPTPTNTQDASTATVTPDLSTATLTPDAGTVTNTPVDVTPTLTPVALTATHTPVVPTATNPGPITPIGTIATVTPIPSDGRFCFGPGAAPVAMYGRGGGLDIYQINGADEGLLIMRFTANDLKALPAKPEQHLEIARSEDEKIIFYKLTSGEYQINVGPVEWLNKVHVCRFSAIPDRNAVLSAFYLPVGSER